MVNVVNEINVVNVVNEINVVNGATSSPVTPNPVRRAAISGETLYDGLPEKPDVA